MALAFNESRYRLGEGSGSHSDFAGLPGLSVTRTHTNFTNAYAETSAGVLVPFAANVARITDKGLLVEESRTNFATNNDFSAGQYPFYNASGSYTASVVQVLRPDGIVGDVMQVVVTADSTLRCGNLSDGTATTTYAGSVYVRNLGGVAGGQVDVVDDAARVVAVGVGTAWQRVTTTGSHPTQPYRFMDLSLKPGTYYIWGALLEAGSFPTSYIPTAGSTATKGVDDDKLTTSTPVGDYRIKGGFTTTRATGATRTLFDWNDGSDNNKVILEINSSNQVRLRVINGGVATTIATEGGTPAAARAATWEVRRSGSNWSLYVNDALVATTAASAPSATSLQIGNNRALSASHNDYLTSLVVYPS